MLKFDHKCLWRIVDLRFHKFVNLGLISDRVFLAGGALRGLFDKEDVICDYDLFFKDGMASAETAVKLEELGYECAFVCPEGLLKTYKNEHHKIQLVTKEWYPTAAAVINDFDINACRLSMDADYIYTDFAAVRNIKQKEVTLHALPYPAATFRRLEKYRQKGYKIPAKTIDFYINHIYNLGVKQLPLERRLYID